MNLVRWDPFRELETIQTRLNRLFADAPGPAVDQGPLFSAWAPAVDVAETDKEYVIKADLPELKKEDVKVELLDGVLTVEGERKHEKEDKGTTFHRVERSYGKFVRRFALPTEIDSAKVQAEFKEGVLSVHLPKTAAVKPKAIEVKVA
jgi:HSP20 family protein